MDTKKSQSEEIRIQLAKINKAISYDDQKTLVATINDIKTQGPGVIEDYSEALGWATVKSTPAMKFLIKAGVNVNAQSTRDKNTALHLAFKGKVKLLIEAKAELNILNGAGQTPLHKNCASNLGQDVCQSIYQLLIAGANPNTRDLERNTPLLSLLTQSNGKISILGSDALAALDNMTSDVVKALLSSGAKLDAKAAQGQSAIGLICSQDNAVKLPKTAMTLLAKGAKIDPDTGQMSKLALGAILKDDADMLQTLIGLGLNPGTEENTLLHDAAWFNAHECAKLLMENGWSTQALNEKGQNVYEDFASGVGKETQTMIIIRAMDSANSARRAIEALETFRTVEYFRGSAQR